MLTPKQRKTAFWGIFLLADTLFCLWICGFILFGHNINNFSLDTEQKTDAIVVLTGGRNRIAEGVGLLNRQVADKLFISGVSPHVTIKDIETQTHTHIDFPERVELGFRATNTIENAIEVKDWIEKNNIRTVRLVTSNYHLPRSIAELQSFNLPLEILPYPVYSEKVSGHWWQSWGTFKFIAAEYNKYLFASARNFLKSIGRG